MFGLVSPLVVELVWRVVWIGLAGVSIFFAIWTGLKWARGDDWRFGITVLLGVGACLVAVFNSFWLGPVVRLMVSG